MRRNRRLERHTAAEKAEMQPTDPRLYYGLAVSVASKFGIPRWSDDDVLQTALEGLCYAQSRHDPSLGASFSTYAHNVMEYFCKDALCAQYRLPSLGSRGSRVGTSLGRMMRADSRGKLSDEAAMSILGSDSLKASLVRAFVQHDAASLSDQVRPDSNETLCNTIVDESHPEDMPEVNSSSNYARRWLLLFSASCTDLEFDILCSMMGDGSRDIDISIKYHLSRERIRQLRIRLASRMALSSWIFRIHDRTPTNAYGKGGPKPRVARWPLTRTAAGTWSQLQERHDSYAVGAP